MAGELHKLLVEDDPAHAASCAYPVTLAAPADTPAVTRHPSRNPSQGTCTCGASYTHMHILHICMHRYVWSVALRGYISMLEGGDYNLVGHGDALPPQLISTAPPRGSIAVEQVRGVVHAVVRGVWCVACSAWRVQVLACSSRCAAVRRG